MQRACHEVGVAQRTKRRRETPPAGHPPSLRLWRHGWRYSGAFGGSGSTTVPVMRFASFYITGWTGQGGGFANPCLGNGDELPTNPAEIVGRFINYVDLPSDGGESEELCDFTALDPCVAVMVE